LRNGCIFVIDELDINLHPSLSKWLIQLFHNQNTNPLNAQLLFTTHNSSLLSKDVFRRDQIWFTEKDLSGSTDLYSLWDFKVGKKVRKEENYEKGYLMGRYGAIPFLGDM
jgi:hypothetical protein